MWDEINKALVEIAVRQSLRSIRRSPERTLRNLVDLGEGLTKGSFSKGFYTVIQEMLQQEDSPYYELLKDVAHNVDNDTLRIFGMNFGYNGCTRGARQIRHIESTLGFHVPWSLSMQIENTSDALSPEEWSDIVTDGKKLGIFIYMVFCEATSLPVVEQLCRLHGDSAFVCFLAPSTASMPKPRRHERIHNLAFFLETADPHFGQRTKLLRDGKYLYGAYHKYGQDDTEDILSNAWIESAAKAHCTFAILLEKPECPAEVRKTVTTYVHDARNHQRFPTIPMAYYADNLWIDQVISDEAYFIGITAKGEFITQKENLRTKQSIRTGSLETLLPPLGPRPHPTGASAPA